MEKKMPRKKNIAQKATQEKCNSATWKFEIRIDRKLKIIAIALGVVIVAVLILLYALREPRPFCPETDVRSDKNGCCPGEVYTNLGAAGWNCCPPGEGDCFPPLK